MSATLQKKYHFELPFTTDPLAKKAVKFFKGKKLLDVGCGEGADAVFYARKGFDVTAIDKNELYLERLQNFCRDKGITNIRIIKQSAIDYKYPENAYDVVSSLLFVCCIRKSEFEEIISPLKRCVRTGGIVVMSSRNYLDPDFKEFKKNKEEVEPNTFRSEKECCTFKYFMEKGRLRECFSDFEVLFYFEGVTRCKYKERPTAGDSMIICRRKKQNVCHSLLLP